MQAIDNNGGATGKSVSFDTIQPVYTWESGDYDYSGGQYIDNPQTNGYAAVSGIVYEDYYTSTPYTAQTYRADATGGAHFESGNDVPRLPWLNPISPFTTYDIGYTATPDWA